MDKLLELLREAGVEIPAAAKALKDLTDEQIAFSEEALSKAGAEAIEAKDKDRAEAAVEAVEKLRAEKESRSEAAAETEQKLADLKGRLTPVKDEEEPEPQKVKSEPEAEKPEEPKVEKVEQPKAETKAEEKVEEPEKELVAASAAKRKLPAKPAQTLVHEPERNIAVMTAAAELRGINPGAPINDIYVLADAFADKAETMLRSRVGHGRFNVGHARVEYPKDRQLDKGDAETNTEKIQKIIASAQEEATEYNRKIMRASLDDVVTADGGLCAPVNVSYDIFGVGEANRPVRDAFTRFQASRGGIRFIAPPVLTDLSDSVTVVTEAQDTAGNTDKACLTITCGSEVTETVSAIAKCLQVGNFHHRTFREHVNRFWELASVAHAREAETVLWDRAVADSTAVTAGQVFGAYRDVVDNLIQAATGMRSRHRAGMTPVRAILPDWVIPLVAVDLLRQLPGDNTYAVTEAMLRRSLAAHNISLSFTPDTNQEFQAQVAGPLAEWPQSIEALVYFEGTHLFLDGGELNFGMEIRDSSLNASNNLRMMDETFEGTAMFGVESLHLTMTVCASGESAGTIDAPCGGS